MRALKAPCRRSEACVSLRPPFPPLVKGVRSAQVTTTYRIAVSHTCGNGSRATHIIGILLQQARPALLHPTTSSTPTAAGQMAFDLRKTLLNCREVSFPLSFTHACLIRRCSHPLLPSQHVPLLGA